MGDELLAASLAVLGPKLYSFYLYGAVTFPHPPAWHLDLDFHGIVRERPTRREAELMRAVMDDRDDLDGYFLFLDDARGVTEPVCVVGGNVDEAWALHRAHVHAGQMRILHGADPREFLVVPEWAELTACLDGELEYVDQHREYPAYCVLQLCRLLHTWTTRNVVTSKYASAQWGLAHLPEWKDAIEAGLRRYCQESKGGDEQLLAARLDPFYEFCAAEIERLQD